jgi:O-antigen ligase
LTLARMSWWGSLPLLVPCGLLIAAAGIGFPFSLGPTIASERLWGLVVASALAVAAMPWLKRVDRPARVLLATAAMAWLGGLWIIAAVGPDVFRGTVGQVLQTIFRPIFGLARVTDPIGVANTRFIVGYNGLADLCAVAIFCCGALLLEGPRSRQLRWLLSGAVLISLIVLIGAGGRGGLTGLAAGICVVALYAWPRRYLLPALVGAPIALIVAAVGILDKGLEFSSTAGRLTFWGDLARLLVEYPLTGVGLGVDTAFKVSLLYEINPDPERVFYAHNTFVQSYLELGPLGALGMLLVPLVALAAAVVARQYGVAAARRPLLTAGLGVVGALEAHGLTDQVVTTNIGTGLVLVGLAAIVASLTPSALSSLARLMTRASVALVAVAALALVGILALPPGRAQALLDFGGLKLNQALAQEPQSPARAAALEDAEATLSLALSQDPAHPAVLRELARVRAARYDDAGALSALQRLIDSPRLDAFDLLQIAHLYRDLGFVDEAYVWAARAYAAYGRSPEDGVMQVYAQSTLVDDRSRTLATQAEAAMRARKFAEARSLFQQALTFEPRSAYLQDRVGAAQRAVDKYGG